MSSQAMTSALSGLRVHQTWMDVIGNNLANSNSVGYRGSRATFADAYSLTLRGASGPSGSMGGLNPQQIGMGVGLHSIDTDSRQGGFTETGRPFDLAIDGGGYFVLTDGNLDTYTRAGTFGLDQAGNLVHQGSGALVRSTTNSTVQLDLDTAMPARATQQLSLGGNLPAEITGPLAEELRSQAALQDGTPAVITGSQAEPFSFTAGDEFDIAVSGEASATVTIDASYFADINNATAAEVAAMINDQLSDLAINADGATGAVVLTTDQTGSNQQIQIFDGTGTPAATLGFATFATGSEDTATDATELNDLVTNSADYVAGDVIRISGTGADGTPILVDFQYGVDGTTVGELTSFVNASLTDATLSLDDTGEFVLLANETGEASLSLTFSDLSGNQGATSFSSHALKVETDGIGPDEVVTSVGVFDAAGLRHNLTMTFTRGDDLTWNLSVETEDDRDVIVDGDLGGIQFNPDGTLATAGGPGLADVDIEIQFHGQDASSVIQLDPGEIGSLSGLTQLGDSASFRVLDQDGFGSGEIANLTIGADGTITGLYSNGEVRTLDQIALANFSNDDGLTRLGNALFAESQNSGNAELVQAGTAGTGLLIGGGLETSNVDTAEQFVRLIEAQRGFQANARVIRASDELLNEVVNLV